MRLFQTILGEIVGLFVDDGSFALAILVWVGIVWLVRPWLPVSAAWSGIILVAGLAVILAEGALRRARRQSATVLDPRQSECEVGKA